MKLGRETFTNTYVLSVVADVEGPVKVKVLKSSRI